MQHRDVLESEGPPRPQDLILVVIPDVAVPIVVPARGRHDDEPALLSAASELDEALGDSRVVSCPRPRRQGRAYRLAARTLAPAGRRSGPCGSGPTARPRAPGSGPTDGGFGFSLSFPRSMGGSLVHRSPKDGSGKRQSTRSYCAVTRPPPSPCCDRKRRIASKIASVCSRLKPP